MLYGLLAVAGAQFCYFSAIDYMQVGPALLIEYTAPAAVVRWLWLRHGERPGPITLGGAGLCVLGLMLVLDLLSGADLSLTGVLWALGAMVGLATYFIINSDDSVDLPPLSLAAGGLVVGGAALGLAGLVGLLPMSASGSDVAYGGPRPRPAAAAGDARPPDRRRLLRHRHRRRSAAGITAGLVRGAERGGRRGAVGVGAARRASRVRRSCSAACSSSAASSS